MGIGRVIIKAAITGLVSCIIAEAIREPVRAYFKKRRERRLIAENEAHRVDPLMAARLKRESCQAQGAVH